MSSVLYYVQHLRGVGHVFRSARIVRALLKEGFAVTVAMGGFPIPGTPFGHASVVQLPPIRANDDTYRTLLDQTGTVVSDQLKEHRRAELMALFDRVRPDVLITETFPLGRRNMQFELIPLMDHATRQNPRPLILGSVRDIVEPPSSPQKSEQQLAWFDAYFAGLLWHGDPAFVSLTEDYPDAERLADRMHVTGLVVPELPDEDLPDSERCDVLVSVGAGVFGHDVLRAAIAAKPLTSLSKARWLLLTGPHMQEQIKTDISAACDHAGIAHEPFRQDIAWTMRHATVSVQMTGYNTVADALAARCRMVALAFDDGVQREQVLRARRLVERGLAHALDIKKLTPEAMARAIDAAAELPRPSVPFDLDGARNTARIVRELLESHHSRSP